MKRLDESLAQIALRAYRRWCVIEDSSAELAEALRARGKDVVEDSVEYDLIFVHDLSALPADLPPHVHVFTKDPAALPEGWREWIRWSLDADGALCDGEARATLRLILPPGYDFAAHARALLLAREAASAMELLENIAPAFLRDEVERARVATERLLCMLPWDKAQGDAGRLNRFARALDEFNCAATGLPREPLAYECMAALWERAGRSDMRLRLISTYAVARDEPPHEIPPPPQAYDAPAPLVPAGFRPRLLFLVHGASDYGSDTLYDGLCALIGDAQVVEFPWKPTLHGQHRERTMGYPCYFERRGAAQSIGEIIAALEAGAFDCVIYSDTLGTLDPAMVARLAQAGRKVPWFVLDQWDQLGDYRGEIGARLGGVVPRAWFKREKLLGADYGAATHALPFAYPEAYAGPAPDWSAREEFFWAGKAACGTRALMLAHVQRHFGFDTAARFTQDEYRARLRTSLIGLSLFGNGFDTVRYWELPAHGVMLLAERPPIEIPNNFVDGESAVFFDDLAGLEERLAYCLTHPDEALRIAQAGHLHWQKHHTTRARAADLLGWMARYLG